MADDDDDEKQEADDDEDIEFLYDEMFSSLIDELRVRQARLSANKSLDNLSPLINKGDEERLDNTIPLTSLLVVVFIIWDTRDVDPEVMLLERFFTKSLNAKFFFNDDDDDAEFACFSSTSL